MNKVFVIDVIVTFPHQISRAGCSRDGKPKGMVQTVVPETEGRDEGPRRGRPRRMPETDVPETYGTDLCP